MPISDILPPLIPAILPPPIADILLLSIVCVATMAIGGLLISRCAVLQEGSLLFQRRIADRRVACGLFCGTLLLYALTLPGITTTLDEDTHAVTRALARQQTFVIDDFSRSFHDASRAGDHFYGHKNPATSVLAVPFYVAGEWIGAKCRNTLIRPPNGQLLGPLRLFEKPAPQCVRLMRTFPVKRSYRASRAKITFHATAARPDNLTLLQVRWLGVEPGSYDAFDGDGNRVDTLVEGNGVWSRGDTRTAWPAKPGGIATPFSLELVSRDETPLYFGGIELVYSGLFPEMFATDCRIELDGRIPTVPENESTVDFCLNTLSVREGQRRIASLLSAFCGALSVVFVYLVARRLDSRAGPAALGALLLAVASLHWRYSIVLYNHAVLTLAVLGALHGTFAGRQDPERRAFWACVTSAWAGLGVLTDTVFALPLLVIGIAWTHTVAARPHGRASVLRNLLIPVGLACLLLGLYQTFCFGAPWQFPNRYAFDHEWLRSFSTAFDTPLLEGLRTLLFERGRLVETGVPEGFVADPSRYSGLFAAEPVLLLGLLGLAGAYRRRRYEVLTLLFIFTSTLLLMAKFRTPWGGGDEDTRYLVHVTPTLYIAVALWWNTVWARSTGGGMSDCTPMGCGKPRSPSVHILFWTVGLVIAFLGLRWNWMHLGEGLGRWNAVWPTGLEVLPAIPKPLSPEALWIVTPVIVLTLYWMVRTTGLDIGWRVGKKT